MPAPCDRSAAFRSTVVYNLGAGEAGADPSWNPRTNVPTLSSFAHIRALAARRGWMIETWLYDDGAAGPLEARQGRWRPAVGALAFAPGPVPSVAASLARLQRCFLQHKSAFCIRPRAKQVSLNESPVPGVRCHELR
jgi:hypothetical protein